MKTVLIFGLVLRPNGLELVELSLRSYDMHITMLHNNSFVVLFICLFLNFFIYAFHINIVLRANLRYFSLLLPMSEKNSPIRKLLVLM